MKQIVSWGVAAALCASAPAAAEPTAEERLSTALELFNSAAFWSDGNTPNAVDERPIVGIYRWAEPIRAFVGPSTTSSARTIAQDKLREMAAMVGVEVQMVDSVESANLRFVFLQEYQVVGNLGASGCVTELKSPTYRRTNVTVNVRLNQTSCMIHELMHVFGFGGHPHQLETVLSYSYRRGATPVLSDGDRLILKALYRSGVTPGMFPLPALMRVRQFLAEDLALVPPGADTTALARPVLDKAVARLRAAADRGNGAAHYVLGFAYGYGQYVAKDAAAAVRFWDLAGEQKWSEALFRAAEFVVAGDGVPADREGALRRYRAASDQGHARAALALAKFHERAGEKIEAYALFDLAARRKLDEASGLRDALGSGMTPDELLRAQSRARELPVAPRS